MQSMVPPMRPADGGDGGGDDAAPGRDEPAPGGAPPSHGDAPAAPGDAPAAGPTAGGASLEEAARVAVHDVLAAQEGERAVVVTNPSEEVRAISAALAEALQAAGAEVELLVQETKTQFDVADEHVLEALRGEPDIGLSISEEKLGKDPQGMKEPYEGQYDSIYSYLIADGRMRGFWSPGVTRETFTRCVPIDYEWLRTTAARLKGRLDDARRVRVTTAAGTDLRFGVEEREAFVDDGDFRRAGQGGNLPAGESYISPDIGTAEGTLVIDGAVATVEGDTVVPDEPFTVRFEKGFVAMVEGSGEAADRLESGLTRGAEMAREWADAGRIDPSQVSAYQKNASHLGEFGVGLNRNARIVGNLLEDEKVYRTCHLAVGSNYDHDAPALIHLDCVVHEPTVELLTAVGREVVVEGGELKV